MPFLVINVIVHFFIFFSIAGMLYLLALSICILVDCWYNVTVMNLDCQKKFAAGLSIFSNSAIIILKLVVGLYSGSISIISEAIHSMSDFLASVLTFFSVIKSAEPADKEHPFGHGKYEDMSGFIEGGLIIFASLFIIYEALKKILSGAEAAVDTTLGLYVMGISVVANIIVSTVLFKVAKRADSVSLFADAEHLRTDVLSSLGVFIGLLAIKFTGIHILDPIIAIVVAVIIFKAGFSISKSTMDNLLDCSLPEEDINNICNLLESCKVHGIIGFKDLKARRLGPQKSIEVTLIFPKDMTILHCHNICDRIEHKLSQNLGDVAASIHLEPEVEHKVLK